MWTVVNRTVRRTSLSAAGSTAGIVGTVVYPSKHRPHGGALVEGEKEVVKQQTETIARWAMADD